MNVFDLVSNNKIKTIGRTYFKDSKLFMNFSGSGVEFCINSNKLVINLTGTKVDEENSRPFVSLLVDDNRYDYAIDKWDYQIELTLSEGKHLIQIIKRTESPVSFCAIKEIIADEFVELEEDKKLKIEFYGDSLTCGFGNLSECCDDPFKTETESFLEGYAYLVSKALDAQYSAVCVSGFPVYKSRWNEGFPIDSVADMISITDYSEDMTFNTVIPWDNSQYIPDLVIINLGANDHSYFTEGMAWIDELIKKYGDIKLIENDEVYLNEIKNLKLKINRFLENLFNVYGNNIKIVWCLFDIYFEDGILYNIIKNQVLNYSKNTYFCDISFKTNVRGAAWHPGRVMHQEAADILTKFIQNILKAEV